MDNNKYNSIIHLLSVAMGSFILNIIDVNSGKAIKGSSKEEKVYAINLEAAEEILFG